MTGESTAVLAETAVKREEATRELLDEAIQRAEQAIEGGEGNERDVADKRLADLKSLKGSLGL